MTIGIDARFFSEAGGIGRYTSELICYLQKENAQNNYLIFLNRGGFKKFQPTNPLFKKIQTNIRWYTLKEQLLMPWKMWQQKIDLMHFPHWNVPLLYRRKFIVTIHDLILLKYPSKKSRDGRPSVSTLNPLFFAVKYWAYKKVLRHAIYDSRKIIVPSEFVKKDILAHFNVPAEKIIVIHEGVTDYRLRTTDDGPLNKNLTFKPFNHFPAKRDPPRAETIKPYLLYIGVAYPHKNLEGLIEAFKIFCDKYSQDYHLVLAGQENYFYQRLKKQFNHLTIKPFNHLTFTGFVPDSQLPALYQNASLYLFPSFYEGFGLPGLEAMSYGLPVLASDSSCLPEIYGDAALYFNPRNLSEMADLMNKTLSDKNLQEDLRQKGFEQVKKYSWEEMARKTMEVYLN